MSEFEILDLLSTTRSNQNAILAQLVSLHFAMIVAIFYFLHKSGMRMKVGVFMLYSLGYALHIGMLWNLSMAIVGARDDLQAIVDSGARLSGMGQAAFRQASAAFTNWVSVVGNVALLALWIGTVYFLFFWKRPPEPEKGT